jgi:hypothetical protein
MEKVTLCLFLCPYFQKLLASTFYLWQHLFFKCPLSLCSVWDTCHVERPYISSRWRAHVTPAFCPYKCAQGMSVATLDSIVQLNTSKWPLSRSCGLQQKPSEIIPRGLVTKLWDSDCCKSLCFEVICYTASFNFNNRQLSHLAQALFLHMLLITRSTSLPTFW